METLSKDRIALLVANHVTPSEATIRAARGVASVDGIDRAASAIWNEIALCITETENRIIDAEFKATQLRAALEAAEHECWSIKCESYPTGGDDADVGWEVISHWQAKPQERVEGRGKTPLEALNDAIDKGESRRIAAAR